MKYDVFVTFTKTVPIAISSKPIQVKIPECIIFIVLLEPLRLTVVGRQKFLIIINKLFKKEDGHEAGEKDQGNQQEEDGEVTPFHFLRDTKVVPVDQFWVKSWFHRQYLITHHTTLWFFPYHA